MCVLLLCVTPGLIRGPWLVDSRFRGNDGNRIF